MKQLAVFELKSPYTSSVEPKHLLKAFDDQGAVVLKLSSLGGHPQSLEHMSPRKPPPMFWKEFLKATVNEIFDWVQNDTAFDVHTYQSHPDVEKQGTRHESSP